MVQVWELAQHVKLVKVQLKRGWHVMGPTTITSTVASSASRVPTACPILFNELHRIQIDCVGHGIAAI